MLLPIQICYSLGSRADCLIIPCSALNTCIKKHKHFLLAMLYDYLFIKLLVNYVVVVVVVCRERLT